MADLISPSSVVSQQVDAVATHIRAGDRCVVLTGAGISTNAGVQDSRSSLGTTRVSGPGLDRLAAQKRMLRRRRRRVGANAESTAAALAHCLHGRQLAEDWNSATPTPTHMALIKLVKEGHVERVISTNQDGLHLRSGLARSSLIELCGNINLERCSSCGRESLRAFDVRPPPKRQAKIGHLYRARALTDSDGYLQRRAQHVETVLRPLRVQRPQRRQPLVASVL